MESVAAQGPSGPSVVIDAAVGELYCPVCETSYSAGATCPKDGSKLVNLLAAVDPLIGRELDGRFQIIERLGQGGMGCVYRASQHSVSRQVAIKVVHQNLVSDPAVIKRFLREAKLASQLSHPNAVSVMDFGQTEDGLFYLVMEILEGKTLDTVLEQTGPLDARRLIRIGMAVCDALEAAHSLQIIHRDLKPSNIMLLDNARDFVKVLDFGLAKSLRNDSASEMTGSGNMIGTPAYMPPERACGESGDERSDLYSLGCILYLLGTCTLPFDSANMQDLLMKQVMEQAPPMTGVPWGLAQVVDKLLRKDPAHRFQTAAETRVALELALEELPGRQSQPSIMIPMAQVASGPHQTMASPAPQREDSEPGNPRGPGRLRKIKSTAVRRLESDNTMSAPAVAAPVEVAPVRPRRSTAKMIVNAMRAPRARWYVAAVGAVALALTLFVSVATHDGGTASASVLPTDASSVETPAMPKFATAVNADPATPTPVEVAPAVAPAPAVKPTRVAPRVTKPAVTVPAKQTGPHRAHLPF